MRASMPRSLVAGVLATATAAQAVDPAAAASYSEALEGLAVVVYEDGELTFEAYHNGHYADKPQHIYSGTKSFAPIVALIAQREGLLELDERVADTITEWRGDELRGQVTIRHLLNFTSGLENIDGELHTAGTRDKYAASIACACVTEPGKQWRYGSSHLMVFGELLERKLAGAKRGKRPTPDDFVAYLEQKVLEPIGCRYSRWLRDDEGQPALPFGAYMTATEWGKFGVLLQKGGKWNEKQIVPAEHLAECFEGTKANPAYGLNFWLIGKAAHERDAAIPADTVAAKGMYKQALYVVPSKELVIVRLGRSGKHTDFSDVEFLGRLFGAADK